MAFLLDTNVVAESFKPRPDDRVIAWLARIDATTAYLSVATIAEIAQGAAKAGSSGQRFTHWLNDDLIPAYAGRIFDVDADVALVWGTLRGAAMARGRTLSIMDALITATAQVHGLTVVSRNVRDLDGLGVPVLDPWQT